MRARASRSGFPPGLRRVLPERRVRDWLVLLGYEVVASRRYLYCSPWSSGLSKGEGTGRILNRGIMQPIQHPGYGPFKAITWPVSFDGRKAAVKPSPLLGTDTAEVLRDWLDLDAGQVSSLTTD